MSKYEEVKFLESYLQTLQKSYHIVIESDPQDLVPPSENNSSAASPDNYENEEDAAYAARAKTIRDQSKKDAKHAARLADDNGFDGSLFRDSFLSPEWDGYELFKLIRRLQKQIEAIPRIISKIEKPDDHSIIPAGAELLTVLQVARLLGWGESVVRQRDKAGLLPVPRRFGGTIQWHRQELKNWMKRGCQPREAWEEFKKANRNQAMEEDK